jgi:pimeloyl-ACP methyl ester carboxylesterase
MRADEARDAARLLAMTLRGGTTRVHEVHSGIAGRVFSAVGPVGRPVRQVHDAIADAVYRGVRAGLGAGAYAAGQVAVLRGSGSRLDEAATATVVLAILNGSHGDLIEREAPALALAMTVRQAGREVPLDRAAVRAAFPDAGDRLVVFLHGLTESERAWGYKAVQHHGRPGVTYGSLLRRDLGLTPVYLRYNTGLHISDNGRHLDVLLARLVDAWPLPVQDLVLIGHSIGGLVARSALHQAAGGTAAGRTWTTLVRDTVTLGTPHLGAPLERAAHAATHMLARLPETRPLARVLATRSVGIKDLRRGTIVADDWAGRDLDAPRRGRHTRVPLHDSARHFVVLATLTRDPAARVAEVVGDLLVPPRSACGDTGDTTRLAFPPGHVHRVGGLHHLDLLNDPRVYEQIHRWLMDRPEGPRPAAPAG